MPRAADRFLAAFVDDLAELELDCGPSELRDRTRAWVLARVGGASRPARYGLAIAGTALAGVVRLRTGRSYERLPAERRLSLARRLTCTHAPVAAEYVKAVRALAVTYVFEARHASAP